MNVGQSATVLYSRFVWGDPDVRHLAKEHEPVVYGITKQLGTVNPFVVVVHRFSGLYREMASAKGLGAKLAPLAAPPG